MCVCRESFRLVSRLDRPVEQASRSYLLPARLTRNLSHLPPICQVTLSWVWPQKNHLFSLCLKKRKKEKKSGFASKLTGNLEGEELCFGDLLGRRMNMLAELNGFTEDLKKAKEKLIEVINDNKFSLTQK